MFGSKKGKKGEIKEQIRGESPSPLNSLEVISAKGESDLQH